MRIFSLFQGNGMTDFTAQPWMVFQVRQFRDVLQNHMLIRTKHKYPICIFPYCHFVLLLLDQVINNFLLLSDKKAIAKRRSLVNFDFLNQVLRSEIFLYRDGQLQGVHVILGFKPISNRFQVFKHVIKAKDARLALIDVAIEGFIWKPPLAGTQLMELPTLQ